MYNIGDVVMYGTFGICKIASIEKRDFMGEENDYYILHHVYNGKNTFYVPVDSEQAVSRLHKVCSKSDVDELIGHMNAEAPIWIDNEIKRKEEYSRIIKEGNKQEIIRLMSKIGQQGLTLIPLSLYFSGSRVKVELGLCRGKKLYDKRETAAKKDAAREIERASHDRNKY